MRKLASSIAVSPPPTTTTSLFRKNAPSQVAHAETPRLRSAVSDGSPSQRALAPVATITARASCHAPSLVFTRCGGPEKSTSTTLSMTKRVPKRSACFLNSSIISGPLMPSGNPG